MSVIRAITHVHTYHSYDSLVSPQSLVKSLVRHRIDLALISDHDSFEGSLEARRIAASESRSLLIPVAAEVKTGLGDVIVIFDELPVPPISELKDWRALPGLVRARQGLIWLPHPFHAHSEIEQLAAEADVIEVYNARCTPEEDAAAAELCARLGKIPAYGADAHLLSECLRNAVEYPTVGTAPVSPLGVLRQQPFQRTATRASRRDIALTQIIKGYKQRRPRLVLRYAAKYIAG